jgi:hypothetical protein
MVGSGRVVLDLLCVNFVLDEPTHHLMCMKSVSVCVCAYACLNIYTLIDFIL